MQAQFRMGQVVAPLMLIVGSALLVSGCLPLGHVRVHAGPPEVIVPRPPPEPKEEEPPPAPAEGWVWQGGHWDWDADDWHWRGGKWVEPREEEEYVPPVCAKSDRGWAWRPGHWRRRGGPKRHHPKHHGKEHPKHHGKGHPEHHGEPHH